MKIAAIPTTFVCFCFSIGSHAAELGRTILPIPEPLRVPTITLDVRNATAPPRFEVKAGRKSKFTGSIPSLTVELK